MNASGMLNTFLQDRIVSTEALVLSAVFTERIIESSDAGTNREVS